MNRLTDLGIKYGTDKATHHGFTDFYYPWFEKLTNPSILEIGLWKGASTRMLNEFFGNATILALDIVNQPDFDSDNITTKICDQSNVDDLNRCTDGRSFDIIIDDGSHIISHQLITFGTLFSRLSVGGLYIIEDLHTSFIPQYNTTNEFLTTYDFVYRLSKNLPIQTPHISDDVLASIRSNIKGVHLYQKDANSYVDGITCVIERK